MQMNNQMQRQYDKILDFFKKEDEKTSLLYHLHYNLSNLIQWLDNYAKTEEEKQIVANIQEKAKDYYQRSLDLNYAKLKEYKENKKIDYEDFKYLVSTIDQYGNSKKTKVMSVNNGFPVYEDGCSIKEIRSQMNEVLNSIDKLSKWIDKKSTLEELLEDALNLENKYPLGTKGSSSPNYNMEHMTREQRDAQAWENYVIESGNYQITDYDFILKQLIGYLKICIKFYDDAISIF